MGRKVFIRFDMFFFALTDWHGWLLKAEMHLLFSNAPTTVLWIHRKHVTCCKRTPRMGFNGLRAKWNICMVDGLVPIKNTWWALMNVTDTLHPVRHEHNENSIKFVNSDDSQQLKIHRGSPADGEKNPKWNSENPLEHSTSKWYSIVDRRELNKNLVNFFE